MAAAQGKLEAGAAEAAQELAELAELAPLDELNRARLQRLRVQIGFAIRRDGDAAPALLEAARRLVPLDPDMALETGLEALAAGIYTGSIGGAPIEALEELRAAPMPSPPRPTDLLLDGLAMRVVDGYTAGAGRLREALEAFRREEGPNPTSDRWLWLACRVTSDSWDDEGWEELANRGTARARTAGALDVLPIIAIQQSGTHIHTGRFSEALALGHEAEAILQATGTATLMFAVPMLNAYRGREAETLAMIETAREDALGGGRGTALSMVETAGAILCNGLGRYEEALAFAERAFAVGPLARYAMAPVELVEAAARCGRREVGEDALEALAERTQASGTDWALALEARARALLGEGSEADRLYAESVERLSRTRLAPHLARSRLLYGEWLRREARRVDARDQLRAAHETFLRIGAEAFAERAGRELEATGGTVRKRGQETADALTPQEAQIARLARDGLSNTEIGAQLFISPRTVQYHLRKVFAKLEITSRRQLGRVAPGLLNPS
jgi:DNA-binding CsgD family transcriptional regulator